MAGLGIIFYLHGYARLLNLSSPDHFSNLLKLEERRKTIWSELESNPGPASRATALTTRPSLLGHPGPVDKCATRLLSAWKKKIIPVSAEHFTEF